MEIDMLIKNKKTVSQFMIIERYNSKILNQQYKTNNIIPKNKKYHK